MGRRRLIATLRGGGHTSSITTGGNLSTYGARIAYLQRAELDELTIPPAEINAASAPFDLGTPLPVWLAEVRAIPRFWSEKVPQVRESVYSTRDILAGLNGQRIPLYCVIRGERKRIRLYIGTMRKEAGLTVRAAFGSYYPGVKLWPEKELSQCSDGEEQKRIGQQWRDMDDEVQRALRPFIRGCNHIGVVTGVPTPNVGDKGGAGTQLDRLIRGLYGTEWSFLVLADPVNEQGITEMQLAILREQLRIEQEEEFRERRESIGKGIAVYYHQLLEMQRQLLEQCLFEGGWWVQSYVCSSDKATYQRAKGLIKGIFAGELSRVDRIRLLDCSGASPKASSFSPIVMERSRTGSSELSSGSLKSFKYHTLVSSGQLSALIHLPRVEMPGYFIQESASFDVSPHASPEEKGIEVGEILDRGQPTGNLYRVPLRQLTKHCLLVGITGSGKTTTAKHLLRQLQEQDPPISFLVIEPAKREYREMAGTMVAAERLRVFTVGEENDESAPFRLNPFEIRRGVSVQTHIDLLKSVFNASFGMWSPLPQVLERAIHEIYRDKGWDTVQSRNRRAGEERNAKSWHPFAQPTLTDLFHKVGELVPKLGYDKEVERNVRTALETRINGLRIGAKGLMLDTRESIPIEHLLARPTVLELEGIGDDDEKAFVMGLILTALYEYYRNPDREPVPGWPDRMRDSPLRHVTVVEEAHRLLAGVPASTDPEATNLKGKAVETFTNMLSEVRAYGEGFIIAEQIPTKLSADVIKNTALKIMQRTVAKDDREVMGGAMNLTEAQLRRVVALEPGEAVVHGAGDDNAFLVNVKPGLQAKGDTREATGAIRRMWRRFVEEGDSADHCLKEIFFSYPTCGAHCLPRTERELDALPRTQATCVDARRVAEDPLVEETFDSVILSLVAESRSRDAGDLPALLATLYQYAGEALRARITGDSNDPALTRCALTHALYRYLAKRGAQYGWTYSDADRLAALLLPCLLSSAAGAEADSSTTDMLSAFCETYQSRCRLSSTPFYGCDRVCGDPPLCLLRYGIEPLLRDERLTKPFEEAGADIAKLAAASQEAYKRLIVSAPDDSDETADPVWRQIAAACFAIQKAHSDPSAWPLTHRRFAIDALLEHLATNGQQSAPENDDQPSH